MIVCLSKSSVNKEGYIQKELKKALDISDQKPEGMIFIIPLRLQSVELPHRLHSWQYTDYFPAEHKIKCYKQLIASLQLRAEKQSEVLANVRRDKPIRRAPTNELIRLIKAIDVVCKSQSCYPFLLQRRLMIGYSSALNLMDDLEEVGVIGPEIAATSNADHRREVLLSFQSLDGNKFSLKQAIESVLQEQWIGVSALQQKMKIDYQGAVRLFNIMEKLGVIGLEKNDNDEGEVLIMQGVFQWS